ncbi:helix-turn-helix domain-containing protein [Gemmatimonas sp.]|jgi:predicted XRE-type DNA-binding protein|uniref:helix-turn-helix domain-containing protein n=1 Tax=Gemmatimonas sp. TaxID=1962908 RepID=UPI0037BF2A25
MSAKKAITKTAPTETIDEVIEESSGNIFADLGVPDAEARFGKTLLSRAISQIIKQRGLKQKQAAVLVSLSESDMSDICRGKVTKFSSDRLEAVLLSLGMNIEMRLTPVAPIPGGTPTPRGRVSVELVAA